MTSSNQLSMDPLIEGYLNYLDKVGRKTPRTIIDVLIPAAPALVPASTRSVSRTS